MTCSPTIVILALHRPTVDGSPRRPGLIGTSVLVSAMARLWHRSQGVRTPARHEHVVIVQPRRGAGQDRASVVPCRDGLVVVVTTGVYHGVYTELEEPAARALMQG